MRTFIPPMLTTLFFFWAGAAFGSAAGRTTAEIEAKALVAMVRSTFEAGVAQGAAIMLGIRNDRVYFVTADHVVRRSGEAATGVTVELRALPGEHIEAELLPHHDIDTDIAVLVIRGAAEKGLNAEQFSFGRLGDTSALGRGAPVTSVGFARGVSWWSNVAPDIVASRSALYIDFESKLIERGQSGGALFDMDWKLVGMVIGESQAKARAVSIDEVLRFVREYGYPVDLFSDAVSDCFTERDNFDRRPEDVREDGPMLFGISRGAFLMGARSAMFGQKRCLHCRVKAVSYRIGASIQNADKAGAAGLYLLDASDVRGEMHTLEVEPGGTATIKHYRDGRDDVTLWAGKYSPKSPLRLEFEFSRGQLIAFVEGVEVGSANVDATPYQGISLGSGFYLRSGAQLPLRVFFDDYEFTACYPRGAPR